MAAAWEEEPDQKPIWGCLLVLLVGKKTTLEIHHLLLIYCGLFAQSGSSLFTA